MDISGNLAITVVSSECILNPHKISRKFSNRSIRDSIGHFYMTTVTGNESFDLN